MVTRRDAIRNALNNNGMAFGFQGNLREQIIDHWADSIEEEIEVASVTTDLGEVSDGYHTFNELYYYRMLYNAHAAQWWLARGLPVVKSWRHHDGKECFGGGWFIVSAQLPTGQVSNHYKDEHWSLFDIPSVYKAPEWDGHTPHTAATRLWEDLQRERS